MGATFSSGTSPSNFERFTRVKVHLAHFLSLRRDLLEKHREIIENVKLSKPSNKDTVFIQTKADKYNKGVQNFDKTTYNMFVYDLLFYNTFENIKHVMVASIEASYIVLVYPNIEIRQFLLSSDKYHKSTCSYNIHQLKKNTKYKIFRSWCE